MPPRNFPSKPDLSSSKKPDALLIAEYERLSEEVAELNKESSNCITFTLTASVGLWAWLFANSETEYVHFIAAMPAVVTLMWFLRSWMLDRSMGEIGLYLAETELHYFRGCHGWENHINSGGKRTGMRWHGAWKGLYFAVILFLNTWLGWIISYPPKATQCEDKKRRQEVSEAVIKFADLVSKALKR